MAALTVEELTERLEDLGLFTPEQIAQILKAAIAAGLIGEDLGDEPESLARKIRAYRSVMARSGLLLDRERDGGVLALDLALGGSASSIPGWIDRMARGVLRRRHGGDEPGDEEVAELAERLHRERPWIQKGATQ
jgi:hypothetical protein